MWNCCNSNYVTRRCGCGSQTNGLNTTNGTNGWNAQGTFGYFIPVPYNGNKNGCRHDDCSQRTTRVSCGNGTFVTVTCGHQPRCGCGYTQCNQTTQTNDNGCTNTVTLVNDCYYARQYGLFGGRNFGCGF